MSAFILSHDLGTTGDKATLFSAAGELVGSCFSEYATSYPRQGWAEQDPAAYWRAFCASTGALLQKTEISPSDVAAVSFSGQMMAALPVDARGEPLRNSIIWADLRSTKQAEELSRRIDADRVYELTGHRLSASYSATKIMWLRENEPELYRKTAKFIHAKDYLVLRLTGRMVTDYSDASGMNLLDIRALTWSQEMLEASQIDEDKLPEIVESTQVVGKIRREAAAECGLTEGTPVVIGGGDGACATCGAGVVAEGEAYIYLGTSTWMAIAANKPLIDPRRRTFTFCHFLKGLYFPAGTMQSGGGSFQWLKNVLADSDSTAAAKAGVDVYDLLTREAEGVPCGSEGVVFLPYLMGERSPLWNPDARACFIGLSVVHRKPHLVRAVLEGVAFNMKLIEEAFEEQGVSPAEIRMIGGGARSRLWRGIFADIMEKPIAKLNFIEEATAVGAAIAGGVGVGMFSSIGDAGRIVKVVERTEANPECFPAYRKGYRIFQKSYAQLEGIFRDLAEE
ncbi:MAG: xylulokinase [Spirochaetales bacterium]|nr:xylulokinase [Spirochaetales bacterium]